MNDEDQRTIYCCNLSDKVDEEIIYELFLQAGPIERVNMPKDQKTGESRGIAFVEYSHVESVPYALQLFVGTKLFSRPLNMRSRNNSNAVQLTPQYIEANNPLTAPAASSRYSNGHQHMQPYGNRPVVHTGGNPFQHLADPSLLMALTANFQAHGGGGGNSYQDLGRYDQRDDDRGYGKHRGHSSRRHDPYRNDHDRRDEGGHRDRGGRDWTNGSRHNRKRF